MSTKWEPTGSGGDPRRTVGLFWLEVFEGFTVVNPGWRAHLGIANVILARRDAPDESSAKRADESLCRKALEVGLAHLGDDGKEAP